MNSRDIPSKVSESVTGSTGDSSEPTDESLVGRAQGGDLDAFDELVARYRGRIYSMIYHLVQNDADAWDLAQDSFVKAWRALPKFKGQSGFYTWLYRVSHNVVYDWLRKKSNVAITKEFDESVASDPTATESPTAPKAPDAPDRQAERADLRRQIEQALAKLSPEHRETILLREVEGLKYEEVAERMECSVGTVMSRLYYARRKLQELLKGPHDQLTGA